MNDSMFCYQCEQAINGKGCTVSGACGKYRFNKLDFGDIGGIPRLLGIKNIRLGPTLPAFVSPAVLGVLAEKFNIMPIKTADEDLKAILGNL